MDAIQVDVLVVGAGPTGLYAAYYAGFRGLRVAVLDALSEVGGQVTAMYPEKQIYDIAGLPSVRGRDLVENLVAQAGQFEPVYLLGQQAVALTTVDDRPRVTTSGGVLVDCGAVIVTGGIGMFSPRPLPVGQDYLGRGLAYFVPRPDDNAGRDVLVVGGGDSAFDWALTLEPIARSVTLVHRRDRFRAHPATVRAVLDSRVRVLTPCQVAALRGDGWVAEADVLDSSSGRVETLPVQQVVAALGFIADITALHGWGLELAGGRIAVDSRMATNLPRVYAAGDITEYPGKVRLISVGFGEAATAVNNAATVLDPSSPLFPGHSTDAGEPSLTTTAA